MPRDITQIIDTLKNEAVGRCRERLEHAAGRAKTIIHGEKFRAGMEERSPLSREEHGVSVLLKRRHGL